MLGSITKQNLFNLDFFNIFKFVYFNIVFMF